MHVSTARTTRTGIRRTKVEFKAVITPTQIDKKVTMNADGGIKRSYWSIKTSDGACFTCELEDIALDIGGDYVVEGYIKFFGGATFFNIDTFRTLKEVISECIEEQASRDSPSTHPPIPQEAPFVLDGEQYVMPSSY